MSKVPITVLVHALNEEVNIPHTLRDVVGWADQIFVIDSESSDRTAEIAGEAGATVVSRPCTRSTLVEQRNWALDNLPIAHEWVLILDADETMDPELKAEVAAAVARNDPERDGYWVRVKLIFMERWIRHASMYPTWSLRLFRKGVVRYERRNVNAHPLVAPDREGRFKGHLLNHDRKGWSSYVQRMDEFSTLEARAYQAAREGSGSPGAVLGSRAARRRWLKERFMRLPFRPVVLFGYLYLVRGGFLDGRAGFDYCVFKATIEWMITVKLRQARRAGP
ncbi:MAG: glycosyltransferase family 2 protein [Gemmatimonadales bacterium]